MRRLRGLAILLAVSWISVVSAQPPVTKADAGRSRRENLSNWSGVMPLSKPALLSGGLFDAILNLNPDQKGKIRDIFAAKTTQSMGLLEEMRARNSTEPFDPTNPQQRAKALNDGQVMAALRQRLEREAEQEVKAVLEPKQWQRLEELQLQFNGPLAFLQPEVQERLHLDIDQVKAIEQAIAKARQEMSPGSAAASETWNASGQGSKQIDPGEAPGSLNKVPSQCLEGDLRDPDQSPARRPRENVRKTVRQRSLRAERLRRSEVDRDSRKSRAAGQHGPQLSHAGCPSFS